MRRLNYLIFPHYQNLVFEVDKAFAYAKAKFTQKNPQFTNVVQLSLATFFIVLFWQGIAYASFSPLDTQMLRINLVENGFSHEWEFDHPDQYEYEIGDKIVKGKHGKQLVEEMIGLLQLQETSQIDSMVAVIKERYPELEHLDIRMRNAEGKLYTWVWNKKNSTFHQDWQR